jgi:hypothetical protein
VTLRLRRGEGNLASVETAVKTAGLHLRGLRLRPARGGSEDRIELEFSSLPPDLASGLLDALRAIDGVRLVTYTYGPPRGLIGGTGSNGDNGADDDDSGES